MKQQKEYIFLQKQILLMIILSLGPGIVYVIFGYMQGLFLSGLLWYIAVCFSALYGTYLYHWFEKKKMEYEELRQWYFQMVIFMYSICFLWTVVFVLFSDEIESNLHYIAIFTQLGASVVASALLVSERKIFIPILLMLILPLTLYFILTGLWYGYVLAVFSLIFLAVLIYSSNNTYKLIEKNYYHANHDMLTGLYNRKYYLEYMDEMILRLERNHKKAYILLIDLDRFKIINDSLGHDVGDKVLKEVANRIRDFYKASRLVVRLGGDEFVVVSREMSCDTQTKSRTLDMAERLLIILKDPYIIDSHHLCLSASIGVSHISHTSLKSKNFLKEADIAMYEAKSQGKDGVIIFNETLENAMNYRLKIEEKLYTALIEKEISLSYQVQVDKHYQLRGCEVLARWYDEDLGEISPNIFIPIAESTGFIVQFGMYILRETFKTIAEWEERSLEIAHISINISSRQLFHASFIEEVEALLAYYISAENKIQIIFEISENILVENVEDVRRVLLKLKALGIHFSMDDFGTGYSSLSLLRSLPIDEVKIDKLFIDHLLDSEADQVMVTTMLSIAKNFVLNVVIEGVENHEQFELLSQYDCDIFQGYFFDKPMNKENFEEAYLLNLPI